ncbi:hypothetical protein [Streptomyces luteolus]|uniref:Lipoprotein n=1 Tax=Streptomyces luteolus TaxID=3043615 RepID=A0ABT6T6Q7_9ACTN|nr:hypothetical protein [Streptomyces sp. B-S-A12]MDI3423566.1 hypothetical protein [Streptomyces sp. B-S-A12]
MTARTRTRRLLARGALAALLAAGVAGCGIRATEVPTEFGPAPSRVPCVSTAADITTTRAQTGTVPQEIFLVCGSQLVRVDRAVRLSDSAAQDPVQVAQALLAELGEPPTEAEDQAGFTSDVKGHPKVTGPRGDDPSRALRISTPPERMSPYELAQIVCTFAQSVAAERDDSVLLGGTGQDSPLRRYECTEELRARPGTVPAPAETVR